MRHVLTSFSGKVITFKHITAEMTKLTSILSNLSYMDSLGIYFKQQHSFSFQMDAAAAAWHALDFSSITLSLSH